MAGVNVSGFLTKSFDWQTMVDQLMEVSRAPIKRLEVEKTGNTAQVGALAAVRTSMEAVQDALQTLWDEKLYTARIVTSDTANTTWKAASTAGAELGSYKFTISELATASKLSGATDLGAGLSATADVSGLTLATLATATAPTAGTFTVNGRQVTVATTDSLQDVFDAISDATDGDVTAAYSAATDRVTLTSTNGNVVLGAANDTSNLLSVLRLANNSSGTVTSGGALGTVKLSGTLASAGLRASSLSASGAFTINGVSISYDTATDSLATVMSRINASSAGVKATYDGTSDRMVLTNTRTGDFGITVAEADADGLLAALGLRSGTTLDLGKNAQFTVNDGPTLTSASNTLDAAVHGITGLSVTVNSKTTQVLEVATDASAMEEAIGTFIDEFNGFQMQVDELTRTTVTGGTVTTSVLSNNREVDTWAAELRSLAFGAVSGLSGTIDRLDDLGVDFDGYSGQLKLKDPDKMTAALLDHPDDVSDFFLSGSKGFVNRMFTYLTKVKGSNNKQQERLNRANTSLDVQIADLERRLQSERELLTSSFLKMQDAQSTAQTQGTYLTNTFFKDSSG
jgi:flagellar hook-associated protein 2